MVFVDKSLHIYRSPAHLLPVHVPNQRLVARIFFGSGRELTARYFLCKNEIQGVSSQLQTEGAAPCVWRGEKRYTLIR
jgi:hypothetical protein